MGNTPPPEPSLAVFQEQLGYVFRDPIRLRLALTHRSIPEPVHMGQTDETHGSETDDSESFPPPWHNERLEFLGDAVLSVLISHALYQQFPGVSEGELSQWRSGLVNTRSLSAVARECNLGKMMRLGYGEALSGGRTKPSILAGGLEALLGAVFLDGGWDAVATLVSRLFATRLAAIQLGRLGKDYKSKLQEQLQAVGHPLPNYVVIDESGAPHEKTFVIECQVANRFNGRGVGRSKRRAEQAAAQATLEAIHQHGFLTPPVVSPGSDSPIAG
jgi:ribonuclease-3